MKKVIWLILIICALLISFAMALALSTDTQGHTKLELRNFESLEELTEWAEEHKTVLTWGANSPANCVDCALYFQDMAFREGYRMSYAYAVDGHVAPGIKVTNIMGPHWLNLAIVGASVYAIEPQPNQFKITYVGGIQRLREGQ